MAQSALMDMLSNALYKQSVVPETLLAGTTAASGLSVDCDNMIGSVHGLFSCGEATGSPDSFTATCTLEESTTGSGSWTSIATQSALVLSADSTEGVIRGVRTKRYVRAVMTPAFVNGSTPKLPATAQVCGQKQTVS